MRYVIVALATPVLFLVLVGMFFLLLVEESGKLAADFAEKLENSVRFWVRRWL